MDQRISTSEHLPERVKNALEFIFVLYDETKTLANPKHKTEKYRTIVLYTISVLEAVLFAAYESKARKIKKCEYRRKQALPKNYICVDDTGKKYEGTLIMALEQYVEKSEPEISFQELVKHLQTENVLKKETAERILKVNTLRNMFHFRKHGTHECTVEDVEEALALLEYSLSHARRFFAVLNRA